MLGRVFALGVSAFLVTSGAASAATVFDFEEFSNGQIITSITKDGLTASVSALGGIDEAVICYSGGTTATCDDPDLLAPFDGNQGNGNNAQDDSPLGNILIVQEHGVPQGGYVDPADDNASGGVLTFAFDALIKLVSVTIVDIETDKAIDIFLDGTMLTQSDTSIDGVSGNNLFELFVPENTLIGTQLVFDANTSFAIDNIAVEVIPVPASLPLLIGGLAGLGLLSRRRRPAAA